MKKYILGRADEIAPGERMQVTLRKRPIVVFNVDGEYFALVDRCPHMGGRLSAGPLTGLIASSGPGSYELQSDKCLVRCPWHGWEFDVRTGKSWCDPSRLKTRSLDVHQVAGKTLMEGPYEAESLDVSREGHYLVVEL